MGRISLILSLSFAVLPNAQVFAIENGPTAVRAYVTTQMDERLNQLSEMRENLKGFRHGDFSTRLSTAIEGLRGQADVRPELQELADYLSGYDSYNLTLQRFVAEREMKAAEYLLTQEPKLLPEFTALKTEYEKFQSLQDLFDTMKDHERIWSFRQTLLKSQTLTRKATSLDGETLEKLPKETLNPILLIPKAFKLMMSLLLHSHPKAETTPTLDVLNKSARYLGKKDGYTATVEGTENLPISYAANGRDVYLYTHLHVNSILDNFGLAHVPFKAMGSIGAADLFFPKVVGNLMEKSDEFFLVGRDEQKQLDKFVRVIKAKKLSGALLPAEGMSSAFYESRPVRERVIDFLLPRIQSEGLRVHIVPITFKDNFRVNGHYRHVVEDMPRNVVVVVKETITADMTDRMIALTGNAKHLRTLVRAQWHSAFINEGDMLESQPSLNGLLELTDKYVKGELLDKP